MAYDAVRPPFTRSTSPVMKLADATYTMASAISSGVPTRLRGGKRLCRLARIPRKHGHPDAAERGETGENMELRHLRYFVAVAETGSLTVAA